MVLKIYNSLSKSIEEFTPLTEGAVTLYTCGPTVYNYPHIGNYRAYLFGDVLKRTLLALDYPVKHVMNITDIDDKTIRDSQKANKSLLEFTEYYTNEFYKDRDMLAILPATLYTKATDHVNEMVVLIQTLIDKGYAYKTDDGSVYFSIKKDEDYGKLSRIDMESLLGNASGRLSQDEYTKEDAQDFALWKAWDKEDDEVFWDTPLGKGRPGWHIECSAMSMKHLGETIDIHTGGIDNMFPHHENEIAQSESATGEPFVNYFMHNEWLLVEGKKMAKSANNFYTLRDIIEKGYNPLSYRYFSFLTHYRTPINFSWEALTAAQNALTGIQTYYATNYVETTAEVEENYKQKFLEALAQDLNTPIAVSVIFEVMQDQNLSMETKISTLTYFDQVLGLNIDALIVTEPSEMIKDLISKRDTARGEKDFAESDTLRDQLQNLGLIVLDTKDGTKVIKAI